MTVRIVNPEGVRSSRARPLAPRRSGVDGLTVGLLDNNKPGAETLLAALGEALLERGAARVVSRRKAHPAGASPYVDELSATVDVAVSALGD